MKIKRALLSVSDKAGIVMLARGLRELGVEIISTGGTARTLNQAAVEVTPVSELTGFPEILGGRVKTAHPRIHGAILARHDHREDVETLEQHGIEPIELVVVNLYPFSETVSRAGVSRDEAVEQIDIGGPSLIRAAAKNAKFTTAVVDPEDYASLLAEMRTHGGRTTEETRQRLQLKAFLHTAAYDAAIAAYFQGLSSAEEGLPAALSIALKRVSPLRYGENPHQRAALYQPQFEPPAGLIAATQHQGKQLSFNNYLDLDAAWNLVSEFEEPCCVIIKHTNPCGVALGPSPQEAFVKALATDPVSAFGSVIGFNRRLDAATAEEMKSLFVEAVITPAYEPEALKVFSAKKNLRVLENPSSGRSAALDSRQIDGGFLIQDRDLFYVREKDLKVVTRRHPGDQELKDLLFAWTVCKHVKSNAIVLACGGQTLGIGAGQMSRVDSVELAVHKSRLPLEGSVMASDAFFPFRDGVDKAAEAGVRAVIEPGGSIRDPEVIEAADEYDLAMVFTEIRHFRHA